MAELPKRGWGVRILMVVGVGFAFIWAVSILALIFGVFVWNREARRDVDALQQTRLPAVQAIRVVAPAPEPVVVIATPESGDYESAVLKSIYAQVNPSVVNITALSSGRELNTLGNHNFNEEDLLPAGGGSGFVWDEYGHIVTNHHVVEGSSQLQVTFNDGSVAVAEIIGVDVSSDLAVLQIDPEGYTLHPVRRGNMNEIEVGNRVVAIGNPFGLAGTMTSGIVSALNRSLMASNSFNIPAAIQTDAAINPGNSGGPLFNTRGEVIGITNMGLRGGESLGFAIPTRYVKDFVRNREAFAYDRSNPNSGHNYHDGPTRSKFDTESALLDESNAATTTAK